MKIRNTVTELQEERTVSVTFKITKEDKERITALRREAKSKGHRLNVNAAVNEFLSHFLNQADKDIKSLTRPHSKRDLQAVTTLASKPEATDAERLSSTGNAG